MDQRPTTFIERILFLVLLMPGLLLLSSGAKAQSSGRWIQLHSDTTNFDSLWVVPQSLQIQDFIPTKDYTLLGPWPKLIWLSNHRPDSVFAVWKSLSFLPDTLIRHKNPNLVDREHRQPMQDFYTPIQPFKNGPIEKNGLNMLGNISRGITTGNNQNVVLNSNLNLQLRGDLGNGVSILAVISDDNNPIQPEGNTQQLQDFDKIFIQLNKKNQQLIAGDFEMNAPTSSYFLKYHKRSRGMQMKSFYESNTYKNQFSSDIALSRGRFSRNAFNGKEGNQGPYRLTGANGEVFMILIAGTEIVYLDGERLKRGDANDYVIDYNSGEVSFTARRIITQYSRIVVEFQYSDRNYARSVFTVSDQLSWKKFDFGVSYFSEQDHKNQPFQQELTDQEKKLLYEASGDETILIRPSEASYPAFDPSRILYVKRDTLTGAGNIPIFVYASAPTTDTVFYVVSFSFVGQGQGHYQPTASAANGKIFKWVAPINGVPTGSYEPIFKLVAPKQQQMLTGRFAWKPDSTQEFWLEGAFSKMNRNTMALTGHNNDQGNAFRAGWNVLKPLGTSGKSKLKGSTTFEQTSPNFRYIERYRNVEFERTWLPSLSNTPIRDTGYKEQIAETRWDYTTKTITARGGGGFYSRNNDLWSYREFTGFEWNKEQFWFKGNQEWNRQVQYSLPALKSGFKRLSGTGGLRFKSIGIGMQYQSEENNRKLNDNLVTGAYAWNQWGGFLERADSSNAIFRIDATRRTDFLPGGNGFQKTTTGTNISLLTGFKDERQRSVRLLFTWRDVKADTSVIVSQDAKQQLLTRVDADLHWFKKAIVWNSFYQTGQGQELKRQFTYLEVQPGMGVYQWNDYNNDGLQQINEFEQAVFKDQARFIRIFVPTNEYVPSYNLQTNQTINLNPGNVLKQGSFLGRLSYSGNLRYERKLWFIQHFGEGLNPFSETQTDTQLVALNSLVRHTLFVNRNNPTFGFDFNYSDARNRQILTNGLETRGRLDRILNIRWAPTASWSYTTSVNWGQKMLGSQFFSTRNFEANFIELKPKIAWQYQNKWRLGFGATYMQGSNLKTWGGETFNSRSLDFDGRYSFKANGALTFKYTANITNYSGDLNAPLAFEILQGFRNGSNHVWSVSLQQRIAKNTQLTLDYNGRKTADVNTVHMVRVEARYLF